MKRRAKECVGIREFVVGDVRLKETIGSRSFPTDDSEVILILVKRDTTLILFRIVSFSTDYVSI